MPYTYQENKAYQLHYQKTSPKAKAARRRYYEKNKDKIRTYNQRYRLTDARRYSFIFYTIQDIAAREGVPFDLTEQDIRDLNHLTCPIFGIILDFTDGPTSDAFPFVDRHILEKGYTKDNCSVISTKAGKLRRAATTEDIKKLIAYAEEL